MPKAQVPKTQVPKAQVPKAQVPKAQVYADFDRETRHERLNPFGPSTALWADKLRTGCPN